MRWHPGCCPWCPNDQKLGEDGACACCGRAPEGLELCPKCGAPGHGMDRSEVLNCPEEDRPEPWLPDWLWPVYATHSQLGTDANGRPTIEEQEAFFRQYGIESQGERRVWMALWQAVTGAKLAEARREMDKLRSDS